MGSTTASLLDSSLPSAVRGGGGVECGRCRLRRQRPHPTYGMGCRLPRRGGPHRFREKKERVSIMLYWLQIDRGQKEGDGKRRGWRSYQQDIVCNQHTCYV